MIPAGYMGSDDGSQGPQSTAIVFLNSRFNSFPLGFFGSASTNTTRFGLLKAAMWALQCSMTACSLRPAPA